jgi:hypothetical protein
LLKGVAFYADREDLAELTEDFRFNEGFGLMLLVSDPQRMSDHGAGILALQDLIPAQEDELPEDEAKEDDECEWSFGGPLGDEEPDEETDRVPTPWEPNEGQPLEQESFYF